nr:hypothetical protein [Tanacetum cinerariifolium]
MGRSGEVYGTVPVSAGAQESCMGKKGFWREFLLGLLGQGLKVWGLGRNGPWSLGNFHQHCVLSTSKILRFALEALRFVYFKDLAFFLGTIAFCLPQRSCVLLWKNCVLSNTKILLFVLIAFCPISIEADIAFYPGPSIAFCLTDPYKPTTVLVQAVAATDDSTAILEHTTVETPMNMSPKNKAHFQAEKEAIHLILTGIGDEIYSTVDACQTAQEMWE